VKNSTPGCITRFPRYYAFAYDRDPRAIAFRRITSGAHESFWGFFSARMSALRDDVLGSGLGKLLPQTIHKDRLISLAVSDCIGESRDSTSG
jgi:hypothetical protein